MPLRLRRYIGPGRTLPDVPLDARHRVVVVGGGFGGLPACRFLSNLPIDVPTTVLNVPLVGTFDITSALRTLVPVPTGNLVDLVGSTATATGRCANGSALLSGSSQVTGLTAMRQTLPTDQAFQQAVTVISARTIDPSLVSLSALPAPLNACRG